MPDLDMADYRRLRVAETAAKYGWRSSRVRNIWRDERGRWQDAFRAELSQALGGLDQWERVPLNAEVTDVTHLDGYRRDTVTFTTRPGLRACGYFLVPDGCSPERPRPAVLCVPGHGRGVDSMVGIRPDESQIPLADANESPGDYALGCVARGYPAFALESIGFGSRRDAAARAAGPGASTCRTDSMAALMVGETLAGWRVWDSMRAIDYLQSRADTVDPDRLAIMGISGGGMIALFTAALEKRLSLAVVSAYYNTFAASILSIEHCVCNYVPGVLRLAEMPDLAALIVPRALFTESGRSDPLFPFAAYEQAVRQTQEIYAHWDAPHQFSHTAFDGGHMFQGEEAFRFLEERLGRSK